MKGQLGRAVSKAKDDGGWGSRPKRTWLASVGWAAILVGAAVALSATVNPALGRTIHWDWTGPLAAGLFALAALSLRRRWV